jgi:hypothetical protein
LGERHGASQLVSGLCQNLAAESLLGKLSLLERTPREVETPLKLDDQQPSFAERYAVGAAAILRVAVGERLAELVHRPPL